MKKAFWWILGILFSPILLFILLTILIYLPPVQNWVVDKVAAYASEQTEMDISVGDVDLSFPIDLGVNQVRVVHHSDTIADIERMVVDVQLSPLFKSLVVINQLEIKNTSLHTGDFVAAACVKGRFGLFRLKSDGIDLNKETVELKGVRLEDAKLDITMNDSVPEDTTQSENHWKIHVDMAKVRRSDIHFHMPGDTMSVQAHFGTLTAKEALIDLGSETYSVASAEWVNGRIKYDQTYEPRIEGLDYNHLGFTNINIRIDSIYYHDPTLRLHMRSVALREKSGIQVTNLTGPVIMDHGSLLLPRFHLQTPTSEIDINLDMPFNITDSIAPDKLQMNIKAQIGKQDLLPFMATLPQSFRDRWPDQCLQFQGSMNGNMQRMEFNHLELSLPSAFKMKASGFVANLDMPDKLRADVTLHAQGQNLNFVMAMLPPDMQHSYRLPSGITAQVRAKANGPSYDVDLTAREDDGTVKVKGRVNTDVMSYEAQLNVDKLNINHFMPRDSIYTLSADMYVKGKGTDFLSPKTLLTGDVHVKHLRYGGWNLDNLTAEVNVADGHALMDMYSRNPLVYGRMGMDALLNTKKVNATLTADINKIDLYQMGLVEKPLAIGLCGHVDLTSDMKLSHYVSGLLSDITVSDTLKTIRSEFVGLHIKTTEDTTLVRAQSGDFIIKLDASGSYEHLSKQITTLTDSVLAQYEEKIIDQPALRRLLPTMKLHVESKRENPVVTMLKSQNMDFKQLLFDISTSPATGVNSNGYVHALTVSDVRLDTINFRLTQRKERLSFGGQIRNNTKNPQFVFNALFDGVLQERGATMGVRYYDAANKLGARLGAQAEMRDSGLHVHLVPGHPILGYKEFRLNPDNYLFYDTRKRVKAHIDLLAADGMGVKIYSEDNDSTALQDITLSLNKFNLDEITSVLPYVPRMTGMMQGDYHVVQDAEGHFSVASDMAFKALTYEKSPIGNVSTELIYMQKNDSAHAVEARLMKDDIEIGLLTGTYYNIGEGSLDAQMKLEMMPLSIANGFIPDHLFGLQGYGDGELSVRGPLSKPQVNGEIYLDSSYVESIPYGVSLRFDNDPIRVVDSKLLLENFTVYAYNKNPLNIQGYIDFSDLERMMVDVRMRANNFQIIGAKENTQSIAYGKAFVNMFAMMKGPADNLNMRGRLEVLGTTDMSYILRDSPLTTDNQLDNLVKFTDFADTTQIVVERPPINGFTMDMSIDVSKGAHIMAYLNTDHTNYIDLMGGGTLRMQYNPVDDLLLTGRYTLSNGEMKYSMPVIPLKTFTIQNGSYIEFTGEPMNPRLNIIATERTKASVSDGNGVGRSVDFDCGVVITKTLNDMGLEFTLDAPEDMQLHSELQSLGVEQRGKLAVTMLTTGMYLADGNTQPFSMNSALSSFLNSEISSITGNALRTLDLSFGVDQSVDGTGSTHTDYSFKFAKRFLNNRLKISVGGMVSTGAELQARNKSFFDNVGLEYRLDDTANKYMTLFYQNNAYDWLDGYTQKYGAGFIWRRSLQHILDIFRFKETSARPQQPKRMQTAPSDSLKTTQRNETK